MSLRSLSSSPLHRSGPGFLLALEGIDGTGKSTLAAALEPALRARGWDVLLTCEPTRGEYGRKLRELAARGREGVTPQEETDLFIADRREHVEREIRPALAAGKMVITDRYYFSTMAYQGAHGLAPAEIEARHRDFAPPPDLLVILDLPVEEALRRITQKRGSTPDHFEGADYLAKVREIFLSLSFPNLLKLDARATTVELAQQILDWLGLHALTHGK